LDRIKARLVSLGLTPRTRMARFTLYAAGMELLLLALEWLFKKAGPTSVADSLHAWSRVFGFFFWVLVAFLALRWFRRHVMWSVRNRLIVTYVFIGVVPIALVLLIASISTYFLGEQFAAYIALSEIEAQAQRLQEANSITADQLIRRASTGRLNTAGLISGDGEGVFRGRIVSVLSQSEAPPWLKDSFHGLVFDQGALFLRAANEVGSGARKVTVVSSVPLDKELLSAIAAELGEMTVFVPLENPGGENNLNVDFGRGTVAINGRPAAGLSAGTLPPAQNRWDREFSYYSLIQPLHWKTGAASKGVLLMGTMRASSLYSRLSASSSSWANVIIFLLTGLAATFGLMVLIAWLIGIRLTRTLTYSVANLYKATEHINRGDFTHRIKVREKDQLAALQTAFNSMTESLQKLIAEQKEKERLQSELEIAHEVQAQLFPQAVSGTRTLQLHGICRPARIVSGDYYDFLSYGPEQMGIAVGDISGKGISAALLMATIHSAVRAYEQEQLAPVTALSAHGSSARVATVAPRVARPSPAQMLWLLNRHLYQSTQPEKYATLFLSFYDDEDRRLTYSNAGHLPPIILGEDGSTRRLEAGGTVVGLFDDLGYEEQTVQFKPGDLFIAFSDGMIEPENEFGEFGEERLVETIAAQRHLPLDRISEHAIAAVQDWIGSTEQPDDVTLVLARRIA
jgi:sigma-B regulation protein RsbU (phosphoserine phosphatase)